MSKELSLPLRVFMSSLDFWNHAEFSNTFCRFSDMLFVVFESPSWTHFLVCWHLLFGHSLHYRFLFDCVGLSPIWTQN
jgi:hypothetical protein